jgi:aldose 1-epimerase
MAFDLKIHEKEGLKMVQLIDSTTQTVIEIESRGALMNSWKVMAEGKALELILGNPSSLLHNKEPKDTMSNKEHLSFEMNGFRSGKMSPFSCRIEKGKYQFEEQHFQFNKFYLGEHAMHGLIYDANFQIQSTKIEKDYASVQLEFEYQGSDPGFPFIYQMIVEWTLYSNHQINVKTTIINKSKNSMPIMDGWHPYFTLGGIVNDYLLEFNSIGKIEMDHSMIPTGKIIEENCFKDGQKIDVAHFDDCYQLDPLQNEVAIRYEGKTITVSPKHNYPYLQVYTPDDRQSIAIENLSGAPNCFNNKMGLQIMEPHDQIYFETTYQFKSDIA